MAVARVNKVFIVSHKRNRHLLFSTLQREGCMHLEDLPHLTQTPLEKVVGDTKTLRAQLAALEATIVYIKEFARQEKLPSAHTDVSSSPRKSFAIRRLPFLLALHRRCEGIQIRFKEIAEQKARHAHLFTQLGCWADLDASLADFQPRARVDIFLAHIRQEDFSAFSRDLEKSLPYAHVEKVSTRENKVNFALAYINEEARTLQELLKRHNVSRVFFPKEAKTPREYQMTLTLDTDALSREERALEKEAATCLRHLEELARGRDYLHNMMLRRQRLQEAHATDSCIILTGWVLAKRKETFEKKLRAECAMLEVVFLEPQEEENPPVALANNVCIRPFEFVTKVYGLPRYDGIDPTPVLAPFFFIFFGMCFGDAGYGLLLMALSWFALKKFTKAREIRKFFQVLLLGGFSATIVGVATGSWFGDLFDIIAAGSKSPFVLSFEKFKNSLVIIDPLREPSKILVVALCFGVVQVWIGNFMRVFSHIKKRQYADALLEAGSIVCFFGGFTGLLLSFGGIAEGYRHWYVAALSAGAALIMAIHVKEQKSLFGGIGQSLLVLYGNASGYISDVLSYCRLWALGLVSSVMAITSNLIAFMLGKTIPYVGWLVVVLILLLGHTLSFAMNLVGTLVHNGRLQFVEFFGKFFVAEGKAFTPFSVERKYT